MQHVATALEAVKKIVNYCDLKARMLFSPLQIFLSRDSSRMTVSAEDFDPNMMERIHLLRLTHLQIH